MCSGQLHYFYNDILIDWCHLLSGFHSLFSFISIDFSTPMARGRKRETHGGQGSARKSTVSYQSEGCSCLWLIKKKKKKQERLLATNEMVMNTKRSAGLPGFSPDVGTKAPSWDFNSSAAKLMDDHSTPFHLIQIQFENLCFQSQFNWWWYIKKLWFPSLETWQNTVFKILYCISAFTLLCEQN